MTTGGVHQSLSQICNREFVPRFISCMSSFESVWFPKCVLGRATAAAPHSMVGFCRGVWMENTRLSRCYHCCFYKFCLCGGWGRLTREACWGGGRRCCDICLSKCSLICCRIFQQWWKLTGGSPPPRVGCDLPGSVKTFPASLWLVAPVAIPNLPLR